MHYPIPLILRFFEVFLDPLFPLLKLSLLLFDISFDLFLSIPHH